MDTLEYPCPECGRTFTASFDDFTKQRTKRCPAGHQVKLKDKGGSARKASKAMSDFDEALRRLGGK